MSSDAFAYDLVSFGPGKGGIWWVQVRLQPSGEWLDVHAVWTRRQAIAAAKQRPVVRGWAYEAWLKEQSR